MKSHSLGADGWDPTMVRTVNRQFLFCPSILISAMYCTGTIFESLGCLAIYNRQAQDSISNHRKWSLSEGTRVFVYIALYLTLLWFMPWLKAEHRAHV